MVFQGPLKDSTQEEVTILGNGDPENNDHIFSKQKSESNCADWIADTTVRTLFEAYYQHTHEIICRVKDIPQQCHQGKGNAKPT
jgi:hypothetical protein